MARSTTYSQLKLNDGFGNQVEIATGSWATQAYNIGEARRLSFTVGILGTGSLPLTTTNGGNTGGFTGIFQVQGTNEISRSYGGTGTPQAAAGAQPGENGWTGALFWNTLANGTVNVSQSITSFQLDFSDIGCTWIRLIFNQGNAVGTSGGSGVMKIYLTTKPT
jgi:hypothetical protein